MNSKIMKQMVYDIQGKGKKSQEIVNPDIYDLRINHEGLGLIGQEKELSEYRSSLKKIPQANTTKITFVKARGIEEKAIYTKEKVEKKGFNNGP
jgi:hypothetical protein